MRWPCLSVVVPFPKSGLSRKELAKAAIDQFFYPILSQQLIVEIHDSESIVLSHDNLVDSIDRVGWDEDEADQLRKRIRLAQWALREGRTSAYELPRPKSDTQPKFDESLIDQARRKELSQKFISGERFAIKVPVPIEKKAVPVKWSFVEVFMEYERSGTKKDDIYARKGLTLIENSGQARLPGLRSILIAEDGPIYEMLRQSENVAHTKWQQRRRQTDAALQPWPIKSVLCPWRRSGFAQAFLSPQDEADYWTLAEWFPESEISPLSDRPLSPSERGAVAGSPSEDAPTEDETVDFPPIPAAKPRQWRAKPTRDGLLIEGNPGYDGPLRRMRLTLAYGLLNQKAYRSHDAYDFSFRNEPDMFRAEGATVNPPPEDGPDGNRHNILLIEPSNNDYVVEIRGFDAHRALDYQVTLEGE